jgi:mono/diheme cytochrome c family protein
MTMKTFNIAAAIVFAATVSSCNHNFDQIPVHENPRNEYAPNMYVSEAYEAVTVVEDSVNFPEAYNVMPYNNGSNLRLPVAGTIKRGATPYHIAKDSLAYANATLVSPIQSSEDVLAEGQVLYERFCAHCHGKSGEGDGPVNEKLQGVANLKSGTLKAVNAGHIFHVITHGKGRMLQHASQLEPLERWKISLYVKEVLQKK